MCVPELLDVVACNYQNVSKANHNNRGKDVRRFVFPDGRAYLSMSVVSVLFVCFAVGAAILIIGPDKDVQRAFELSKANTFGVLLLLARSCFPEAFFVKIGKRGLFYYSFDAIWAVNLNSWGECYECIAACPVTGYAIRMYAHVKRGADESWDWIRSIFLANICVVLVVNWSVIVSILLGLCHVCASTLWWVLLCAINGLSSIICVACLLFRRTGCSLLWWRKLVRVPTDEDKRRELCRAVWNYVPFKRRK